MSCFFFYNKFLKTHVLGNMTQAAMFLRYFYLSEIPVNSFQPLWCVPTPVLATVCPNFSLPQLFRVFKFISGKLYWMRVRKI